MRRRSGGLSPVGVICPIIDHACRALSFSFMDDAHKEPIKPCPPHGQGANGWLLGEANRQLKRLGPACLSRVRNILTKGSEGHGPNVGAARIERALRKAWLDVFAIYPGDDQKGAAGAQGSRPTLHRPPWPVANREAMASIHEKYDGIEVGDLEAHKFSVKNPRSLSGRDILSELFRPGEFVCLGSEAWSFNTWLRDEALRRVAGCCYVVPNPFRSRDGLTKSGKPTRKSDSQVLGRRFVIVEFDFKPFEWARGLSLAEKIRWQARLHWHLAHTTFPLALIVFSGNESLHGWYVAHAAEHRNREFLRKAVELGADYHLWVPSQFTRTPAAQHQNGKRQEVIFFRPEVINL